MKQHTQNFEKYITTMGRQIDIIVSYVENGQTKYLLKEDIISMTPYFEGNILKSVMKQFDFETKKTIAQGTIVKVKLGILVNNALTVKDVHEMMVKRLDDMIVKNISAELNDFEYLDYGNYIVTNEPTYNADLDTYTYTCFDKMLYSMVDYESLNIIYPITIRNYINAICTKIGLTFKNINDTFANYNKEIQNELYLDEQGNSLGYTFRDVLDELAQVTASIICINENTDELEIRYVNETNTTINEEFLKDINVEFKEKYGPINTIVLSRSAGADNIYYPQNLPENPCEIKISDNQIMNFDNRDIFMPDIYEKLNGLEYYVNDFNSTGILWYELGDLYNVQIEDNIYKCLMLNDEINVNQGLGEIIYTNRPEETNTDYKKADTTDRKINKTIIEANKQKGEINAIVTNLEENYYNKTEANTQISISRGQIEESVSGTYVSKNNLNDALGNYATTGDIQTVRNEVSTLQTDTNLALSISQEIQENGVTKVHTEKGFTFDNNGLTIDETNSKTKNVLDTDGMEIIDKTGSQNEVLLKAGYDEDTGETKVKAKNITVDKYFIVGEYSRVEKYGITTGVFWIGG